MGELKPLNRHFHRSRRRIGIGMLCVVMGTAGLLRASDYTDCVNACISAGLALLNAADAAKAAIDAGIAATEADCLAQGVKPPEQCIQEASDASAAASQAYSAALAAIDLGVQACVAGCWIYYNPGG